jgi:hypothetical protein
MIIMESLKTALNPHFNLGWDRSYYVVNLVTKKLKNDKWIHLQKGLSKERYSEDPSRFV